jgi:hypothetical protein
MGELLVTSAYGPLLASALPGQTPQQVRTLGLLGTQPPWRITPFVDLGVAVYRPSAVHRSDKSPPVCRAEPPRTWRLALRTRW